MAHTYTDLLAHIIFSTKDRQPLITSDLKPRLHAYICGIVTDIGGKALIVGGIDDHVHLLANLPKTAAPADTMRTIKANSSKWAHDFSGKPFAWQGGYGAFSVSRSNVDAVYNYIASQEEHHKRMTFQEEYLMLLKKHGIEYDERYLWT